MRTTLEFLAAMLLLAILFIAQLAPSNALFWMASLSVAMMVVRYTLLLILLWFLIAIPENPKLRMAFGMVTLALAGWVLLATVMGWLDFIDTVILAPAVIAILGALLETKPEDEPFKSVEMAAVARDWLLSKTKPLLVHGVQLCWLAVMDIGLAIDEISSPKSADIRLMQRYRQLEDSAILRVRHV